MRELPRGRYEHYKGKLYEVIDVAIHSETLEKFVVYRALYESKDFPTGTLWVRPAAMFSEKVEKEGVFVPRFKYISSDH